MNLWIATSNAGKWKEYKHLFQSLPVTLHSMSEIKAYTAPPENGKTFLDNARIKAKNFWSVQRDWVIGEDAGLEVEGLGGLPGIHSARYAGPQARDSENVAKLLKMLQLRSPLKRNARFVCTLVVYSPEGREFVFEGELKGEITKTQKGTGGFGYDPVFIPEGQQKTLAEMDPGMKNQLSHRAQATKKFIERVRLDFPEVLG